MGATSTHSDLRTINLFQHLSPRELAEVEGLLQQRTFAAGTTLISAQQPGEVVYLILNGTVKIHMEQLDGSDVVIAMLGAGDVVGEMSLLDSAGRSASVVTQEESTLAWMQRAAFQHCLNTIPTMAANLVRTLTGRLRMANAQIQALATLDVSGRVARQLLAFAERYGIAMEAATLIPMRLTQSDLAALVGASRERVNQAIVGYKQQGVISINQRFYIIIHDLAALAADCQIS